MTPQGTREQKGTVWSNWSGNQTCRPLRLDCPPDEDAVAEILRRSQSGIRIVGSGHSFSPLVPTEATLIDLRHFTGVRHCDEQLQQVTCGSGTTIHDLGKPLFDRQLALINQGDVDAQTLAGAMSTATHGTGLEFGCLASDITALRMVTLDGQVMECDSGKNSDLLDAARVSLGSLGVITELTIQCRSAYCLEESLATMTLEECLSRCDELAADNRHFEFFHFPHSDRVLVKRMNEGRTPGGGQLDGDRREDRVFSWLCWMAASYPRLNPLMQRWAMRIYSGRKRCDWSYRVFPSARTVRFNEMEYEVPADAGTNCLREIISELRKFSASSFFPIEFRRVKRDSLWLSPFHQRDSVSISIHQHHRLPYQEMFNLLEPIFWKYEGRPHWGKIHSLEASTLSRLYARWNEFLSLRQELDPQGRLLNPYLRRVFGVS